VVKELCPSTVQHYRDFCRDNNIDLSQFRQAHFLRNAGKRDPRLCQALSQIAADPSVDSETLLITNKVNASGDLLDLLLIPKDAPYYDFPEEQHDLPPIREGDMFVVSVSRRGRFRGRGFEFLAVVQDEESPQAKLERASLIALREVSVIWGCNPRELSADTNAVTRAEFVDKIRNLKCRGINVKHSITERFPELETRSSRPVAA